MALPTAASDRQLKHRRSIEVQIYARGNGLWEVDAHITDLRSREIRMATGMLPAGQPIHDMLLRLVVDERFNVIEAGAFAGRAAPGPDRGGPRRRPSRNHGVPDRRRPPWACSGRGRRATA